MRCRSTWSASPSSSREYYRQAINIIVQSYRRESEALQTLEVFADNDSNAQAYLRHVISEVLTGEAAAKSRLKRHADEIAKSRHWKTLRPAVASKNDVELLVPVRNMAVRGPINVFRPQYGQDWLKVKLQDENFLDKLRLARRGRYYTYETLNFVNGQLNLGQIRDRMAAEYGPVPLEEIEEYFRMLEKVGVITLLSNDKSLDKK